MRLQPKQETRRKLKKREEEARGRVKLGTEVRPFVSWNCKFRGNCEGYDHLRRTHGARVNLSCLLDLRNSFLYRYNNGAKEPRGFS
jgi:hypothetical protein